MRQYSVKPQVVRQVLEKNPDIEQALQGKVLISICAGVRTQQLKEWLPKTGLVHSSFSLKWALIPNSSYNPSHAKYPL
jgi:hypothetical protein